jgi:glycosyltransferase involved in cell wall biosynthesis
LRRHASLLKSLVGSVPAPQTGQLDRIMTVDLELSESLPRLGAAGWSRAHVLVRLHGHPLGALDVDLSHGNVPPEVLKRCIDDELGERVVEHLAMDGMQDADRASASPEDPAARSAPPRCIQRLEPPCPAPLVSVVIATRNRSDLLATCLRSILNVSYPELEVIVVDNAPSDGSTRDVVHDLFGGDPRVRYVHLKRAGASLARNVGAAAARGEVLAFTDDDAVVDRLWLSGLVAGFASDPRVACVSGLTLPSALETAAQQAFEAYGGMGLGFEPRLYDLEDNRGTTLLYPYTAGIFGASNNVAFRREFFIGHGGFDVTLGPGTPVYGAEDLDLFLSVILNGYRIAYQPVATVRHEHRADFAELYWQVFSYSAGFTALLTKWALNNRRVAGDLATRVPRLLPAALLHAHRSGSEAGVGNYASQLRWLERAGYLYGPLAYLASRLVVWRDARAGFPPWRGRSRRQRRP